jgi:hypothetical protein
MVLWLQQRRLTVSVFYLEQKVDELLRDRLQIRQGETGFPRSDSSSPIPQAESADLSLIVSNKRQIEMSDRIA